jgi:hypothetical protein
MAAIASPMAARALPSRSSVGGQRVPAASVRAVKARRATVGVRAAANGPAGSIRDQAGRRGE